MIQENRLIHNLDLRNKDVRIELCNNKESGSYIGITDDGVVVHVVIEKNESLKTGYLNSKDWLEFIGYDNEGNRESEWVEKI